MLKFIYIPNLLGYKCFIFLVYFFHFLSSFIINVKIFLQFVGALLLWQEHFQFVMPQVQIAKEESH